MTECSSDLGMLAYHHKVRGSSAGLGDSDGGSGQSALLWVMPAVAAWLERL